MISSRIQSTAIAYIRAVVIAINWSAVKLIAFGKQTWRIGGCGCNGRLLHKKCELCPGYPLLCIEGLCYGFLLLTLQERVMLGQNGREANKKNNHLANLAPEEFTRVYFRPMPDCDIYRQLWSDRSFSIRSKQKSHQIWIWKRLFAVWHSYLHVFYRDRPWRPF